RRPAPPADAPLPQLGVVPHQLGEVGPVPRRDVALERARVRRVPAALRPVAGETAQRHPRVAALLRLALRLAREAGSRLDIGDQQVDLVRREHAAPGGHGDEGRLPPPRAGAAARRGGGRARAAPPPAPAAKCGPPPTRLSGSSNARSPPGP